MEKELFLSTLKSKAGVDNVSDRSFEEVAGLFLPQFADDEKVTDELWNMPVSMVKTMSGQLRHDLSTGINDFKAKSEAEQKAQLEKEKQAAIDAFKAQWEKEHPMQEPLRNEPVKQETDIDAKLAEMEKAILAKMTGDDSALGKLSKQFSDFMSQVAAEKQAQTEASVREQIKDYLVGRGVDEEDFALEYTLEKLDIGEKPDVSALKAKAEKDYEAYYKKIHRNDGAQPFNGGAGGPHDSNTEFQNFIKARQAEAAQEAKDAEELRKQMM